MKAYDALHVFPEIPKALKAVRDCPQLEPYIFSNGTEAMVGASVKSSPDLKPYADLFKGFVTTHDVQTFKPAMSTYEHLLTISGKEGKAGEDVWVVSANPFDALGARVAGLKSAWVDRAGKGWTDQLGAVIGSIRPSVVVSGVEEAVREIIKQTTW